MIDTKDLEQTKVIYQSKINDKVKTFTTNAYECLDSVFLSWLTTELGNLSNTNRLRFRKKLLSELEEMKNYSKRHYKEDL